MALAARCDIANFSRVYICFMNTFFIYFGYLDSMSLTLTGLVDVTVD